ncbi:hypothetical protein L1286_05750 [Pseudoalteromonas sp. SMS1]|nr:hypothetical protein [Pseudoalteromonas sp. SMS1]
MEAKIHTIFSQIKDQIAHRQGAIQLHASMAMDVFVLIILRWLWEKYFIIKLKRQPV